MNWATLGQALTVERLSEIFPEVVDVLDAGRES